METGAEQGEEAPPPKKRKRDSSGAAGDVTPQNAESAEVDGGVARTKRKKIKKKGSAVDEAAVEVKEQRSEFAITAT